MMTIFRRALCGALLASMGVLSAPEPVRAAGFDLQIDLSFDRVSGLGLNRDQLVADVYQEAETLWESLITGYQHVNPNLTGIRIDASVIPIDGRRGILGRAGPTHVYNPSTVDGSYLTYAGIMEFDGKDVRRLLKTGEFLTVVLHEMAHVIGFGTLWSYNGLYPPGSGSYIGASALAEYRREFDPNANSVPVELDGGGGTADAHWDESWAGGGTDVMTGYLSKNVTFSNTTIHSFRDLGYETVNSFDDVLAASPGSGNSNISGASGLGNGSADFTTLVAVPLPTTGLALGTAVALLAFARRRRRH